MVFLIHRLRPRSTSPSPSSNSPPSISVYATSIPSANNLTPHKQEKCHFVYVPDGKVNRRTKKVGKKWVLETTGTKKVSFDSTGTKVKLQGPKTYFTLSFIKQVTDYFHVLQNNDISPGWFNENVSFGGQMSTIKESRRSPLPVKRYQVKLKEEDVYESQGGLSSVSSGSGISMIIDDSDDEPTAFKPQCQQKSANDLVPTSNRYKAREDEKRIKVASPMSQLSIADSSNGRKSEAGNKYGCVGSKGRGFSCILTTKQIHHKSTVPLVYVAKAFLGIIMLFLFVQKMLLYGSWC